VAGLFREKDVEASVPRKKVLHVGCGPYNPAKLHQHFRTPEWQEVRLDIDPAVQPDVVCSITDLGVVASESVDGVWSSHNLEHLYWHEVPRALREFRRVLKPGGVLLITMPDLQQAAAFVAQGNLEGVLYTSPAGPISAIDVLFGHRASVERGNAFMAHKTGFTAQTLAQKLHDADFVNVQVQRDTLALWAHATR
jgi:SAM-dependent methyltransferase